MSYEHQPGTVMERNLEDCRQLAELVFVHDGVGVQSDITFAPLKKYDPNPFSVHFIRMVAKQSDGTASGSLELVEYNAIDKTGTVRMGYDVAADGRSSVVNLDRIPNLGNSPLDWPTVMYAPQINDCISNFRSFDLERYVDPDALLDELTNVKRVERRKPHLKIRQATELDIHDYDVDLSHGTHQMPKELSDTIGIKPNFGEWLKIVARYQGKAVLGVTIIFDGKNRLVGFDAKSRDVSQHVSALASFKRAVFGTL